MQDETDQQRREWLDLPAARIKIAERFFGDPTAYSIGEGDQSEIMRGYTREQIEEADQMLYNALTDRKLVAYWRTRSLDPKRTPIDANDLADKRVWDLIIKARRTPRGLDNPAQAGLVSTIVELSGDDLDRWLDEISPTRNPAARKGGRPTAVDWKLVGDEIHRLMEHHGDFVPGDLEWNAQARLEQEVMDFCRKRFEHVPSVSTVRKRVKTELKRWRDALPKN